MRLLHTHQLHRLPVPKTSVTLWPWLRMIAWRPRVCLACTWQMPQAAGQYTSDKEQDPANMARVSEPET